MTASYILFNDFFTPARFSASSAAGEDFLNSQSVGELLRLNAGTGDVDFSLGAGQGNTGSGSNYLFGESLFGLINVGDTGLRVILFRDNVERLVNFAAGNGINRPNTNVSFNRVRLSRANAAEVTVGGLFIGERHEVECFYPRNWRSPIVQPTRADVRLSNNGLPMSRYVVREPFETTLPIRHHSNPESLRTILRRMQREPFLWQWKAGAPVLYCWSEGEAEWRYSSPNRLDCDIRIRGVWEYA